VTSLLTASSWMPDHWPGAGWVAAPSFMTSCPNASSASDVKTIRLSGLPTAEIAPETST